MKKVSVIIPTYNSEKTISETLISVRNQTYTNIECIIVDDNSSDKTLKSINDIIGNDPRFKIIHNLKNKGGAKARNQGLRKAKGEFIMFLDSDDLIKNDCIEKRVSFFNNNLDYIVFPNFERFKNKIGDIKNNSILNSKHQKCPLQEFLVHKLPLPWNISSVLWSKDAIDKLGGFNENYRRMQDVELHTRALIVRLKYKLIWNSPDFFYRETVDDERIKEKRNFFYNASIVYIKEILTFTTKYNPNLVLYVKKELRKFLIEILTTTLISKQFSKKQTQEILWVGFKYKLISYRKHKILQSFLTNRITYSIFQMPIIRNIIFHSSKLIINRS